MDGTFDNEILQSSNQAMADHMEKLAKQRDALKVQLDAVADMSAENAALKEKLSDEEDRSARLGNRVQALADELEKQENATVMHADTNRAVAEALGQEFGETWHDLGAKVAALKAKLGEMEKEPYWYQDGDMFQLLCKASSKKEGWMKSTKAMQIDDVGCVVQVTTQQGDQVSEALTFVPRVRIDGDAENGRRLVSF